MADFQISVRLGSQVAPVALMRLTETKDPDELLKEFDRDDIVVEGKLDGWKAQIIKAGGKVSIYSRRGEDVTANFPELAKALASLPDGTLVEGELVYWHDGKQDVGKVTSLAGSTAENALEKAKELPGEMKVHLYDILWYKGKNVAGEPFSKRRGILQSAVKPTKTIQLTKQYPFSEWQDAMNEAVKSGGEGIVLKIKSKPYEYKAKGEQEPKPKGIMYKYKGGVGKSDSDDYVVYEYEMSDKGKLKALFGQYYKGKLYHISEISNFSKEDEETIKSRLGKGPLVIEIGFQERVPGGLRHQKFLRFREDKKPKDATMNEFHVKHIDNFEPVKSNAVSDWVQGQIHSNETGVYDIGIINELVKSNPAVSVPLSELTAQLESREWGEYSPKDVLDNPEKYPEEIEVIRNVNLDCPIFIHKDVVIDGNHRLAKAFMVGAKSVKVKFITDEQMEQARDKDAGRENATEDEEAHHGKFVSELARILGEAGVPLSAVTIGGSGVLGALGKKKVKDLDVNVDPKEFPKVLKHPDAAIDEMRPGQLRAKFDTAAGEIEMFTGPWVVGEKDYMTDETPVVEMGGLRYWSPEHALEWKTQMNRPKDLADIELLKGVTRKATFALSKRASYADEVLDVLEKKFGPKVPTMSFTGLKDVPGVDIKKAYQIICMHESSCSFVVGDSGTSFGTTQVQFGSFVNKLAAHPEAAKLTGISSAEYRKLGEAWNTFTKQMRGVNLWIQVPVDEAAVKAFMQSHPNSVVARREGTTIRYSPTNVPGVVRKVGDKYVGNALDIAKLKELGLNVDSPYIMSQLKLLTDQFITNAVVRNGIVKLFIAQNNPDTYAKFQRTFSRKNVMANKDLSRVAESVTQQDFMNRVNAVVAAVRQSGYDTTAPGAYNIYQLIAIANGSGVGAVQNFLLRKKPFFRGQVQGGKSRMNKIIEKVTGIASDLPPNDGMAGFKTSVASLVLNKTAEDEWQDDKTPVVPTMTNEMLVAYDITLRKLWEELYKNDEELLQKVWVEYEEELGRKIERSELPKLLEREVAKHITEHWHEIPERKASAPMLSKRAAFADAGALYFPGQYAEEIKSGKRQMTIRANDVPVETDEVVKCMTYSGAHVCDIKITSKETMSLGRVQKAFGKHIARSLEQKFGKNRRFVVIRFELFKNVNEADDLPTIQFPQEEYKGLERRLRGGKGIYTTRISRERGKYKEGQEFMTPWGHKVKVVSVVQLEGVENHPFLDELTEEQRKQIGRHKYDLIRLEKVVRNKADDEDDESDKKWEEVLIEKDGEKLTRKQIRSHYEKPDIRKKIMARIKGKPVLIYLGIGKNQKVLKRNHDGKQIVITNDDPEKSEDPHNYFYWTKRRLLSIHEVFGTKTDLGFVDLDIHGSFKFEQAEKYARALAGKIKEKFGSSPTLYQSGGSGIHVEFMLKDEVPINDLRKDLKELLDEINEDWDDVTTGVVKGSGMRSDVSTLHNKGSLRVPWSLGETYGKVKKPLSSQDDDDYGNDTWGRKNISEPSFPPGDAIISQPQGGTVVSPTGNVGSYNMSDDKAFAMSVRGGLVRTAHPGDIEEEYLWLWDGERLHTAARVLKDAGGKSREIPAWHYDLAMKAGFKLDDKYPRGFVTFYRNRKPEITTYDRSFWDLPSRLQSRLETAMELQPGGYTIVTIDLYGDKTRQEKEAYERLSAIWKFAARLDDEDEAERFWEEHPELVEEFGSEEDEGEVGYGSEEEEEATRRPIKKAPPAPVKPKQPPKPAVVEPPSPPPKKPVAPEKPKKPAAPETPEKPAEPKIKPTRKTFKDIVEPQAAAPAKKTRLHDRLIDEILNGVVPEMMLTPDDDKGAAIEGEDVVSRMLAGEDEDIGKELLEKPTRTERQRSSLFGRVEPMADDKGEVLGRWPVIEKIPQMSNEARLYFTPENLSDGPSLRKLFMNPKAWDLLRNEKHLIQSWILPAVIMTIGKKWFDINSMKNTVERTPFKLFDENDAAAIKKGMLVEDLPKTRKYIQDINKILAKVLEAYFAMGYSGMPIDGYCYTALRRSMTPIIAEDNHYKETRYPVCAVCRARKPKGAEMPRMERTAVEKNLWTCLECKRKAEQLEDVDLPDVKAKISKLGDEIGKAKHSVMQAGIAYEDADTEQQKQKAAEKIEAGKRKYEALKIVLLNFEEKRESMSGEIRKLRAQTNVPYMHTWCPNEACPGMRVPLTSIDWDSPFWKTSAGEEARIALKEKMEIMPPDEPEMPEQRAADLDEGEKKGNEPPAWMLDVPFVCPHDGVRFTLKSARGRGYGQKGGFFWKPYQRSEWTAKSERAGAAEALEQIGVDNDADERIAYQQLGVLARNIFLKKYWDVYNSVANYVTAETEKGRPMERIVRDQTYISLRRRLALYDAARDFSVQSSELFVGWLAGREFGKEFVREGKKIKSRAIVKNKSLLSEKREEIYLPLLQQWVDKMLSEKGGYEKYGIDEWVTNSEMDGIPHLDGGAYFVSRIEGKTAPTDTERVFSGFECRLRPKMRGDKPVRGQSEPDVKLLRVLGVWSLTSADMALLKKIDSKLPGTADGTAAIQNSETVRKLLKGKQNRISELSGHDFRRAALDAEESLFAPGEYILVKALVMPGKYHWAPIDHVRNLRKDSDEDDMFYQLGLEASGHNDDPAYWAKLNDMLKGLRSPEEMKAGLEALVFRRGATPAKETIAPVVTVPEDSLNESYQRWLEISKKKRAERKRRMEIKTVSLEGLESEYRKYLETLPKKPESDARDPLSSYKKKREFDETPEPEGKTEGENKHRFVIQLHKADRAKTHYDLRLENDDGAMSSWAVPKHKLPSAKERLLAVKTEDHPISYMRFEGEIPKGEYGAGKVERHDSGTYEEIEWGKSKIVFRLKGKKEKGIYNLIHTDGNRWLLMKAKGDEKDE